MLIEMYILGPHVLRAVELYKGRFIAYSLGNFATYGKFGISGETALAPIVTVSVDSKGVFVSAKVHDFVQVKPGGPQSGDGAFAKIKSLTGTIDFLLLLVFMY